jgi:hypothetical protein
MRRINHRGLVAAMEEENLLPQEAEGAPLGDLANSQEEGLVEIAEDEAGLAEHDMLTDEAVETAEALESIRDDLKAALESGGLEQGGAAILRTSLAHLYRRVGVTTKRVTPALESFGSIARREDSTNLALEEVSEQIKKVWASIVAAIKRAIEWVKNFVKKLLDNVEPMIKRATELKEHAGKVEGEAKEKSFKNGSLAKALHLGGKVAADASAAQRLAEVAEKVFAGYKRWADDIKDTSGDVKVMLEGASDLSSKLDPAKDFGLEAVHDAASQGLPQIEGGKYGRSAEMPGGNALVIVVAPKLDDSKVGIMPFNKAAAEFKGEDVPVLSKEAAIEVADLVIKAGESIKANQAAVKDADDAKNNLMKAADAASKAEDGKHGEAVKAIKGALKLVDAPYVALASYVVKAGKSLNQHIEQSLKAYGAAEKKDEPAAAAA